TSFVSGFSVTVASPRPFGSPDASGPDSDTLKVASSPSATRGASSSAHAVAARTEGLPRVPRFCFTIRISCRETTCRGKGCSTSFSENGVAHPFSSAVGRLDSPEGDRHRALDVEDAAFEGAVFRQRDRHVPRIDVREREVHAIDRKSTRLNSSHVKISYAV